MTNICTSIAAQLPLRTPPPIVVLLVMWHHHTQHPFQINALTSSSSHRHTVNIIMSFVQLLRRYRPVRTSHILFLPILLTLLASSHHAARTGAHKRQFEYCDSDTQCDEPLSCRPISRRHRLPRPNCSNADVYCECTKTPFYDRCHSSADCHPREACAQLNTTGSTLCVGCTAVVNEPLRFRPVEPGLSQCGLRPVAANATPEPAGVLGLAFDFCAPDVACAEGYLCLADGDHACSLWDTACSCKMTNPSVCEIPEECPDGETCAMYTKFGLNMCMSCSAVQWSISAHLLISSKCDHIPEHPVPDYAPGPNGLALDPCRTDLLCAPGSVCRNAYGPCTVEGTNCLCMPVVPVQCRASVGCQRGEVCARLSDGDTCVSLNAVNFLGRKAPYAIGVVPSQPPLPKGAGLSDDICKYDWDCVAPRRCTHREDAFGGCAGRRACQCKPLYPMGCKRDIDCSEGERCTNIRDALSRPFCTSARALNLDADVISLSDLAVPATPQPWHVDSLTYDRCRWDQDCKVHTSGRRYCRHLSEDIDWCKGRASCFCRVGEPQLCEASDDCPDGEACARVVDGLLRKECRSLRAISDDSLVEYEVFGKRQVVGPEPTEEVDDNVVTPSPLAEYSLDPSPSADVEETVAAQEEASLVTTVCIAMSSLQEIPQHDLIFAEARRASVLCDVDANCATAGHMVVWKGSAMMMQSYCKRYANCVRRIMHVNSPRMRRGLRLRSARTVGLEYTALAAQYESRIEEGLLSQLVHMGIWDGLYQPSCLFLIFLIFFREWVSSNVVSSKSIVEWWH